jgi:flagellar export protein FliJ
MKRFEFRFARLARVRAAEEGIARDTWQKAEARHQSARDRVKLIRQDIAAATEDLRRVQADPQLAPREVLAIQTSMQHLDSMLEAATEEAETLRVAAEEAREPWQALRTELEGLSRLEEKGLLAHRREVEREEIKQMDQIASERAARTEARRSRSSTSEETPDPATNVATTR